MEWNIVWIGLDWTGTGTEWKQSIYLSTNINANVGMKDHGMPSVGALLAFACFRLHTLVIKQSRKKNCEHVSFL
jgi:hypothetical protein